MSSPRDRDGFDDRGTGDWQEPDHLGRERAGPPENSDGPASSDEPPAAEPTIDPASTGNAAWQPAGWDLPAVEPDRPTTPQWEPPAEKQRRLDVGSGERPQGGPGAGRGPFGPRRRREPGAIERVFRRETDPVGVQGWALHYGWVPSDGTGPQDASLADLVRSAPVRASKDHRPGNVIRGRGMGLDLVAFDVVYASGRYLVPQWAVTAAPVLGEVPAFRLSPARLWKHRTSGLLQIPSGDPEFDSRWVLLAAVDGPQVRRVAEDPVVRQLLLATDDGDELWSATGFVAAIRPDGHRPQLIEHQARILAMVVGALAAA